MRRLRLLAAALAAAAPIAACSPNPQRAMDASSRTVRATAKAAVLLARGRTRELREPREGDAVPPRSTRPAVWVLALDGVDRHLLYGMLREGKLPELAKALGGRQKDGSFPHAHLDERVLSTLPSVTFAAWATTLTGVTPSEHGATGNEFFIREERRMAAPIPDSFSDTTPTLDAYLKEYGDEQIAAPTVWERMRAADPGVRIWVSMQHIHRGADRLLFCERELLTEGVVASVKEALSLKPSRDLFKKVDEQATDTIVAEIAKHGAPDVLHQYVSGTDMYAHVAAEGPDASRRSFLAEVTDKQIGRVAAALAERGQLDSRYVVVIADHGHTQVMSDDEHSLMAEDDGEPPEMLKKAGFRVRALKLDVSRKADFQAVLAYQGAMAFVYLADRTTCAEDGDACAWEKPPRYKEDVLAAAEAFHRATTGPTKKNKLAGTLDMILVREPRPVAEEDLPFQIYLGGGKVMPVGAYLAQHPHPTYVKLEERLRDLGVGKRGERAGDVVLLAHNGDRDAPGNRFYFAAKQHSWHGSPSENDGAVPLIVARATETAAQIERRVSPLLGDAPRQNKVTDVLLELRR